MRSNWCSMASACCSIELSVSSTTGTELTEVGHDVAAITGEMEALRQALEVTG